MLCCCLSEGKPIPTELRKDEAELRKAIEFDDEKHERKCGYFFRVVKKIESSRRDGKSNRQ